MKRTRIAAVAAALALGSTAALAVSGDAWYGTNRYTFDPREEPVTITMVDDNPPILRYEARPAEPMVVEREYVVTEPVIVHRDAYYYDGRFHDDPLFEVLPRPHPENLFTREGPNDFGA